MGAFIRRFCIYIFLFFASYFFISNKFTTFIFYLLFLSMSLVGNLTGQRVSVGKLPDPCVGTLQAGFKTGICRNFAYASPEGVVGRAAESETSGPG